MPWDRRSVPALAMATLPGDRRIEVSFGDDPFVVPANLAWMPGEQLLTPAVEVSTDPDVVLTFDASSIDRLGLLREIAEKAPLLVAVDHHAAMTVSARSPWSTSRRRPPPSSPMS